MQEVLASVDLGGTNIKCVLATPDGQVLARDSKPTESHLGPEGVLDRIAKLVQELSSTAGVQPAALGMGVPGLADLKNGVTKFLPNMPTQWKDVPVRELLSPKLNGCPVYLLNDVRMATLGELVYGHGREADTLVFLALGTGIGGGVVIEKKLRVGPVGAAGELGHLCVLPNCPRCGCGSQGCLETLASGPAITAEGVRLLLSGQAPKLYELVQGDAGKVTPKEMAEAAAQGDEAVRTAIVRAARFLGIGIAQVVTTLHPDMVVLGGGVANIGSLLFETVRDTLRERVKMVPVDQIKIVKSKLGDQAGALGGIALAARRGEV